MVVSGHVHSYSRTCEVYNAMCVGAKQGGITHVVVGTGGHESSSISST